jgi:hypothetical protein
MQSALESRQVAREATVDEECFTAKAQRTQRRGRSNHSGLKSGIRIAAHEERRGACRGWDADSATGGV